MRKTVNRNGHRSKNGQEIKARANKGKSKGKCKLNSIENWQEDAKGDEHADGWTWNDEQAEEWWKAAGDQNGSSSAQWTDANEQTAWEPEGPIGGLEMNSIETKYIEEDELGQNWLRLNHNSAALTALPIAIAGDLPLEKSGEFQVASGAVFPNLGKIKMKSMDESGIDRTVRGNIEEVSKPLLSAAEASKRWDLILFEDGGILQERRSLVALKVQAVLQKHKVWNRHGKKIRLYREGNLCNAHVRTGDVTQKLAPVEPAEESWTRMEVDDGQRDKQEESEDQPEDLRSVGSSTAHRAGEAKHSQMNHAVFALRCIGDRRTRIWRSKNNMDPESTQISFT